MGNLNKFNISWDDVEVTSFEALPAGDYAVKMVASEMKLTKKKDEMLSVTFEVLGKNKGRKIFETYMMTHSNPKAVQAGLGRLKALAQALNIDFDALEDTSEFHGKPVGAKVVIDSSEQYGDQNRIKGFMEYDESFLEGPDSDSSDEVEVDEVDEEPAIVEDEDENEDDEVVEEEEEKDLPTPAEIRAFKKAELLSFVKDQGIDIVLTGKKVTDLKEEVIDKLFSTVVDEDDDEIIIEDE